jgi:Zinc dependent phospholipase C
MAGTPVHNNIIPVYDKPLPTSRKDNKLYSMTKQLHITIRPLREFAGCIASWLRFRRLCALFLVATLFFACAPPAGAYAILAHEALIDSTWDANIRPLLRQRFPQATDADLQKAHAYAYGGSIIQDLGYYPFGSKLFSDLTHYVRSGDFVLNLLADSQDVNEYAFALGALAHYAADNVGHRVATNRAVPLLYPKLRRKFGDVVAYEDDPTAHLRTEFSFDILQVARGAYAPDNYHDFIGFEVSKPLLQRAFQDTYALPLDSVFVDLDLALGNYRFAVSSIVPEMTRVAWQTKKDEIAKLTPGMTRQKFLYHMSRSEYEKDWGKGYTKPGFRARLLALLFRILPKIGPLKALKFRALTPQTEALFLASFDGALQQYRELLVQAGRSQLKLANENFDLGEVKPAGDYRLADDAYARLVDDLAERKFAGLTPTLRANILDYYAHPAKPVDTEKNPKQWAKTQKQLNDLKAASVVPEFSTPAPAAGTAPGH